MPLTRLVSAERDGYVLTPKEREIHEKGLVSVLKQIHDELDAAGFDAYGWPHELSDEEILERLVALKHERAEEEKRGLIRWLRPEFQNPAGGKPSVQNEPALEDDSDDEESEENGSVTDRPKQQRGSVADRPERRGRKEEHQRKQVRLAKEMARANRRRASVSSIPQRLRRPRHHRQPLQNREAPAIEELLETLVAVGQARQTKDGRYVV